MQEKNGCIYSSNTRVDDMLSKELNYWGLLCVHCLREEQKKTQYIGTGGTTDSKPSLILLFLLPPFFFFQQLVE